MKLLHIFAAAFLLLASHAIALDKNGNFESKQEQDAFISATLKKMAMQMNSQMPIQVDQETKMMSVIALQKSVTYSMRTTFNLSQVDLNRFTKQVRENLNHTVCQSKATIDLIDRGVQYIYLFVGNDGKLITRIVIDSYRC